MINSPNPYHPPGDGRPSGDQPGGPSTDGEPSPDGRTLNFPGGFWTPLAIGLGGFGLEAAAVQSDILVDGTWVLMMLLPVFCPVFAVATLPGTSQQTARRLASAAAFAVVGLILYVPTCSVASMPGFTLHGPPTPLQYAWTGFAWMISLVGYTVIISGLVLRTARRSNRS